MTFKTESGNEIEIKRPIGRQALKASRLYKLVDVNNLTTSLANLTDEQVDEFINWFTEILNNTVENPQTDYTIDGQLDFSIMKMFEIAMYWQGQDETEKKSLTTPTQDS